MRGKLHRRRFLSTDRGNGIRSFMIQTFKKLGGLTSNDCIKPHEIDIFLSVTLFLAHHVPRFRVLGERYSVLRSARREEGGYTTF